MITKAEKKRIKKLLGHRYTGMVQDELNKNGEFNKNGEPYNTYQIANVMNGIAHDVIEAAIYRVVEKKKTEIEKRKRLLETP